jgi:hypothetical protein
MKRYLLILATILTLNSYGQGPTRTTTTIDKNSTIKTEDGSIMPYVIWQKMVQSGDYGLKPIVGSTEFSIYRLTPEQKAKAAERKKTLVLSMGKPRVSDVFTEGEKFKGEKMTDINGINLILKI